jgi:NAD(P)H-dependent FMN reductase
LSLKLHTLICSTRPGRVGPALAGWFHNAAVQHGGFDAELVDLAAFNLPVFDEPHHPMQRKYQNEHTKAWSRSVEAADAFVFVTPEYNFGPPPSLLNALNYLYLEWNYKPVGFVSYGGISGGLRSVQMEKLTVTTLKMMPVYDAVTVPFVAKHIKDGVFTPEPPQETSAKALLDELLRWAGALKPLRGAKS